MAIIAMVGIHLAKNIFQYHTTDSKGHRISGGKWSRATMIREFLAIPPCTVALEACAGAHHLARTFGSMGHKERMLAPQYVAPFRMGNKNDKADANLNIS